MKTNEKSLSSISRTEDGVEIVNDLELVELKGGRSVVDVSFSGINCPNQSGNCVAGCACSPSRVLSN